MDSIQLRNFRGIESGTVAGFRQFNLLVGPNNSGKSAVLEAMYLGGAVDMQARMEDHDEPSGWPKKMVRLPGRGFGREFPLPRVLARHRNHWQAEGTLKCLADADYRVQPSASAAPLRRIDLRVDRQLTNEEARAVALIAFDKNVPDDLIQYLGEGGPGRVVYLWYPDLTYFQTGTAAWRMTGALPAPDRTLLHDVSNTLDHISAEFFGNMLNKVPGWSQKIGRRFGRIFGIKQPFNVIFTPISDDQKWIQGWIAPEDRVALPIDAYGDGARSAFKVLTPLTALAELSRPDAPGLFLWEEPELFQNPEALGRLLHEVADLARGKPLQICMATQSLEVVAHFDGLVRRGAIATQDLAIIRTNLEDGKLSSSLFSAEDVETWTDMKLDVRVPSGEVDSPLVYQVRGKGDAASDD